MTGTLDLLSTLNDIITIRHRCGKIIVKWFGSFWLEEIPWTYFDKKIKEHRSRCNLSLDFTREAKMTEFLGLNEPETKWPTQMRIDETFNE
jgi:hypothetical protein